jgi:ribose/xylose/arabinose/galactoside ABC-type transport system permease subunit
MILIDRFRALRVDLKKHLLVGAAAGYVAAVLAGLIGWHFGVELLAHPVVAGLVGFAAGVVIGWLKEYRWDAAGHGTVDRADYLFTGRGAVVGAVLGALTVALLWT